ncbi:peroxiredoxin [Silvibacterium bohemicum]|uniref:Peroxiredoxin n=1 Tax=Silvibacterium bohemicum TaxID=1577686 RepID=A0A841JUT6_9BACT|nr:TlpA disulfide reductase family protein [Silvibacterium bohemicum]MBB6145153.1 peroxiredoxin [Silvibacterium bohemicum]
MSNLRKNGIGIGRGIAALLGIALLGSVGCDRGSRPAQVGGMAPDFTIHDGGKTVSLSQYRGQTVVLNYWASWCPPCLEEFPSLMQLQQQVPGVVVMAISFDTDADAYHQYLAENHLSNMVIALDLSQKSNLAYGTTRPPETYVIDAKGRVRRKFIGAQDWTSPEIENYLRNL